MKFLFPRLPAVTAAAVLLLSPHARGEENHTLQELLGGVEVTNGGIVVICHDSEDPTEITSATVLDYFEARSYFDLQPAFPLAKTHDEMVKIALDRLREKDPGRAARYKYLYGQFRQRTRFVEDTVFDPTKDSNSYPLPVNCKEVQAAIQRAPRFEEEPTFIISQDVWDVLGEEDRAGLILHELIYWDAIRHGAINSRDVRYINAIISTPDRIAQMSAKDWQLLMFKVDMLDYLWKDSISGRTWVLSENRYATLESAREFCQAYGLHIAELHDIRSGSEAHRLRESFIGLYHLFPDEHSGIVIWALNDSTSDTARLTKTGAVGLKQTPEDPARQVLCTQYFHE